MQNQHQDLFTAAFFFNVPDTNSINMSSHLMILRVEIRQRFWSLSLHSSRHWFYEILSMLSLHTKNRRNSLWMLLAVTLWCSSHENSQYDFQAPVHLQPCGQPQWCSLLNANVYQVVSIRLNPPSWGDHDHISSFRDRLRYPSLDHSGGLWRNWELHKMTMIHHNLDWLVSLGCDGKYIWNFPFDSLKLIQVKNSNMRWQIISSLFSNQETLPNLITPLCLCQESCQSMCQTVHLLYHYYYFRLK